MLVRCSCLRQYGRSKRKRRRRHRGACSLLSCGLQEKNAGRTPTAPPRPRRHPHPPGRAPLLLRTPIIPNASPSPPIQATEADAGVDGLPCRQIEGSRPPSRSASLSPPTHTREARAGVDIAARRQSERSRPSLRSAPPQGRALSLWPAVYSARRYNKALCNRGGAKTPLT